MAKRLTETDLWRKQRWFRKLTPNYKLAFCYIKDECDHAGFWRIDCTDLIEDLGIETFDMEDFVSNCNTDYDKLTGEKIYKERLRVLEGRMWVTGFIQFQYKGREGTINPDAGPVISALKILSGYGLMDEAIKKKFIVISTQKTLLEGRMSHKDKDKDKDKDIETVLAQNSKTSKNGKHSRNFKAQGEELYAQRVATGKNKDD